MESTYLVDAFGTLVADDDELSLYVQCDGVLHVMLGKKKNRQPLSFNGDMIPYNQQR